MIATGGPAGPVRTLSHWAVADPGALGVVPRAPVRAPLPCRRRIRTPTPVPVLAACCRSCAPCCHAAPPRGWGTAFQSASRCIWPVGLVCPCPCLSGGLRPPLAPPQAGSLYGARGAACFRVACATGPSSLGCRHRFLGLFRFALLVRRVAVSLVLRCFLPSMLPRPFSLRPALGGIDFGFPCTFQVGIAVAAGAGLAGHGDWNRWRPGPSSSELQAWAWQAHVWV